MSAEAMGWVYRHSPFKGATFSVHLAIADSMNDQYANRLFIAQGKLAVKARCSRQKANTALQEIVDHEDSRWLELIEERLGRPNEYQFHFPEGVPVVYESRSTARTRRRPVDNPPNTATKGVTPVDTPPTEGVAPDDTPCQLTRQGVSPQLTQIPREPNQIPTSSTPAADGPVEEEVAPPQVWLDHLVTELERHGPTGRDIGRRLAKSNHADQVAATLATAAANGWTPTTAAADAVAREALENIISAGAVMLARVRLTAADTPTTTRRTADVSACPDCHGRIHIGTGRDVQICTHPNLARSA